MPTGRLPHNIRQSFIDIHTDHCHDWTLVCHYLCDAFDETHQIRRGHENYVGRVALFNSRCNATIAGSEQLQQHQVLLFWLFSVSKSLRYVCSITAFVYRWRWIVQSIAPISTQSSSLMDWHSVWSCSATHKSILVWDMRRGISIRVAVAAVTVVARWQLPRKWHCWFLPISLHGHRFPFLVSPPWPDIRWSESPNQRYY